MYIFWPKNIWCNVAKYTLTYKGFVSGDSWTRMFDPWSDTGYSLSFLTHCERIKHVNFSYGSVVLSGFLLEKCE